jgi:type IV secretion system protein TrbL
LVGGVVSRDIHSATTLVAGAREAYAAGAAGKSGMSGVGAGLSGVARAGAQAMAERFKPAARPGQQPGPSSSGGGAPSADAPPAWAAKLRSNQHAQRAADAALHTLRGADHGGSGAGPDLGPEEP